jgi:hypothetical protein
MRHDCRQEAHREWQAMVRFDGNKPLEPLRPPARRHYLRFITPRSQVRPRNTIILPGVNLAADVRAINAGEAIRIGEILSINGRRYWVDQPNTLYPIDGDGLVPADRGTYKAIGIYNQFGLTPAAEDRLERSRITIERRQDARRILRLGGLIS